MNQATLKYLRLIMPAIIIMGLYSIAGLITGEWNPVWPKFSLKQWEAPAFIIVPALVYYATPFRDWTNRIFFDQVSENLREQLVKTAGYQDNKDVYSWKAVRGIFYHLIDSDPSLKAKTKLAYFNGFVWTTFADLRALAAIASLVMVFFYYSVDMPNALFAAAVFSEIVVASIFISPVVTHKQMEIGNQQIEIVNHLYIDRLKERLDHVRQQFYSRGN